MKLKTIVKKTANKFGLDILKYPQVDLRRRIKLVKNHGINTIFDIGANEGQYAKSMRELGFNGRIISFEPLSETFKILEKNFKNDNNWKGENIALGNTNDENYINVAEHTTCSSILNFNSGSGGDFSVAYKNKEKIRVKRLDNILQKYLNPDSVILLKIDVQGYEKLILDGLGDYFDKIKGIQIEMSLIELYKGEELFMQMINFMKDKGLDLYSIENVCYDGDSGRLLQIDGLFFRN